MNIKDANSFSFLFIFSNATANNTYISFGMDSSLLNDKHSGNKRAVYFLAEKTEFDDPIFADYRSSFYQTKTPIVVDNGSQFCNMLN
jgi:hypothetical protein